MGALSQNDLAVDGTLNTTKQTFAYGISTGIPLNILIICGKDPNFKVRGPFVQTLCIEKDSYMDAI